MSTRENIRLIARAPLLPNIFVRLLRGIKITQIQISSYINIAQIIRFFVLEVGFLIMSTRENIRLNARAPLLPNIFVRLLRGIKITQIQISSYINIAQIIRFFVLEVS